MRSNCLIEAIKAKLKDWNNVEIHLLSPKLNRGELHFYWIDKKNQEIRQFAHRPNEHVKTILLFKGRITNHNIKLFESSMYSKMKKAGWSVEKQKSYANKKGFLNKEPFEIEVIRDN